MGLEAVKYVQSCLEESTGSSVHNELEEWERLLCQWIIGNGQRSCENGDEIDLEAFAEMDSIWLGH